MRSVARNLWSTAVLSSVSLSGSPLYEVLDEYSIYGMGLSNKETVIWARLESLLRHATATLRVGYCTAVSVALATEHDFFTQFSEISLQQ